MVLLKSKEQKSQEIADFLGFCQQAVNFWLHRYKREGISGLLIKEGRGRPSILSPEEDFALWQRHFQFFPRKHLEWFYKAVLLFRQNFSDLRL